MMHCCQRLMIISQILKNLKKQILEKSKSMKLILNIGYFEFYDLFFFLVYSLAPTYFKYWFHLCLHAMYMSNSTFFL